MKGSSTVNIFWFRRDLRLYDNAGLYQALKSGIPVVPLFIFDPAILDLLPDKDDSRVTFICDTLSGLNAELQKSGSALTVYYRNVLDAWREITTNYTIGAVFTNHDYEPYARKRDMEVEQFLKAHGIELKTFKDHVIFEKDEVVKDNGEPYTVFTPYKKKWMDKLAEKHSSLHSYPVDRYISNFAPAPSVSTPSPEQLGFRRSSVSFPPLQYRNIISNYHHTRDFPGIEGTTRLSVHLRFGTVSIREVALAGRQLNDPAWLNELIWREFYSMILWHFPHTVNHSFKPAFDNIKWLNNKDEFEAWCNGLTGYPLVDAGMRQLNATGWMHNRARMITASFLCKHLLVDWRWGESYFARKLIDYDMASNVGGWQWAAGSGTDAVPYFRIFNPDLQTKKFDPQFAYIKKWVPEFTDPFRYQKPLIDHNFGRNRALEAFKTALRESY